MKHLSLCLLFVVGLWGADAPKPIALDLKAKIQLLELVNNLVSMQRDLLLEQQRATQMGAKMQQMSKALDDKIKATIVEAKLDPALYELNDQYEIVKKAPAK